MTDSTVEATQDVVPLLDRVLKSRALEPHNRALIGLVLSRFHRKGAHLPVHITDDEFKKVMRVQSIAEVLVSRRWFESCGMIDRFEMANGDCFYVPKFYGVQGYIKNYENQIAGTNAARL